MWQGPERRRTERRKGERRCELRDGAERRRRERRAVAGTAVLLAAGWAAVPDAAAQVYTRRNERGVIEATNIPDRDFRLTYPGKGTLIHSKAWKLRPSYNGSFDRHISAAAALHGVEVSLVRAIIQVESDFDHLAISSKGAQGLMQLMPDTARRMGVTNAFDPRQNIFGGVRYLRFLLDMFRGDIALVAAAYNAGENAVTRFGGIPPYKETRNYVEKVQTLLGLVVPGFAPAATVAASFFAPNPGALTPGALPAKAPARATSATARRVAFVPLRPRVYYKWADLQGVVHLTQAPPAEGIVYTMIRALD